MLVSKKIREIAMAKNKALRGISTHQNKLFVGHLDIGRGRLLRNPPIQAPPEEQARRAFTEEARESSLVS